MLQMEEKGQVRSPIYNRDLRDFLPVLHRNRSRFNGFRFLAQNVDVFNLDWVFIVLPARCVQDESSISYEDVAVPSS